MNQGLKEPASKLYERKASFFPTIEALMGTDNEK
jgi:hypothetical protein